MENMKSGELNNFLCTFMCVNRGSSHYEYNRAFFYVPRIYCKDGFSISIQIHHGNYCASENGTREFGLNWKLVEWGFPNQEIDGDKYNAENPEDVCNTVGGYVEIELIEGLLDEHGGIDYQKTFEVYTASSRKRYNHEDGV